MKFQTTFAFTLLLLTSMLGAGAASAFYGFSLGYEALQGVKQPENNPTYQLARHRGSDIEDSSRREGIQLVSERQILVAVYDQIYAQEQQFLKDAQSSKIVTSTDSSFINEPDIEEQDSAPESTEASVFPISTTDNDILFEIVNGQMLDSQWVMEVNLQNNSRQSVKFFYDFLEIEDDQGRLLTGVMEGLPEELPANNQKYVGEIQIPSIVLSQSESISLTLKDYPTQNVSLKLSDIPVEQ